MRKNGNWLIKETKVIFANDFFTLSLDKVINPENRNDEYATIQFKDSIAVIALDENRNIYLTKQFRYALERENIEAVAGAVENENTLAAAKRELKEELGIVAEDWANLGKTNGNTSITKDGKSLFLARRLTFENPKTESTEQIKQIKMPLNQAVEKVLAGEIPHDVTCLLILKTAEFLRRENG